MLAFIHSLHHSISQSLFVWCQFTTKVISWHFPNWASLHHTPWWMYLQRPSHSPMSNTWWQWWETTPFNRQNQTQWWPVICLDWLAHTFIHWWQRLPCCSSEATIQTHSLMEAPSGAIWGSVSCPRMLRHEDRNQSDPLIGGWPSHSHPHILYTVYTVCLNLSKLLFIVIQNIFKNLTGYVTFCDIDRAFTLLICLILVTYAVKEPTKLKSNSQTSGKGKFSVKKRKKCSKKWIKNLQKKNWKSFA